MLYIKNNFQVPFGFLVIKTSTELDGMNVSLMIDFMKQLPILWSYIYAACWFLYFSWWKI